MSNKKSNLNGDHQKLKLAFLWHQHQPYYKNPLSNSYSMPWVRLHAVKDYLDMLKLLKLYPKIKQTYNFVPSLLEQIIDYSENNASDPHLDISVKDPAEFTDNDKITALDLLFQANYENMILPSKRYSELYSKRGEVLGKWDDQDWLDLQCHSNLAWIDPMFKSENDLALLVKKDSDFIERDKQTIIAAQRKIISNIIPTLKEMSDSGQIEISVSPYFHPIMPLLFDSDIATEAMPHVKLPTNRFAYPEDVDKQIEMAVGLYKKLFGKSPDGMWPSEGSVSEDIIPIIMKHGIKWIATDEEVLAKSLDIPFRSSHGENIVGTGKLYRAYEFSKNDSKISIFFRDHVLSDNIGFVYSQWEPGRAADDFINRLKAIKKTVTKNKIANPVVSVILDGENAWEYYKNDGRDFLEALYKKLSDTEWIETVTFSGYLDKPVNNNKLPTLFAGSWINHNFGIWIGHDEDNKAWDLLFTTRAQLCRFTKNNPEYDSKRIELAWKEIYICEGSDWCWWFGDDHVGPNNDEFDRVFRTHLSNVYRLLEIPIPSELLKPIRTDYVSAHIAMPINYISPVIDGRITQYYEWEEAGFFDCLKAGSTMHKSEHQILGIWFGLDHNNLYLMVKPGITVDENAFKKLRFEFTIDDQAKSLIIVNEKDSVIIRNKVESYESVSAFDKMMEVSIPMNSIIKEDQESITLRLNIYKENKLIESWPSNGTIEIAIPRSGSDSIPWTV